MIRVTEEQARLLFGGPSLPVQLAPGYKRRKKPKQETGLTKACIDLLWAWGIFAYRNNTGAYERQYTRQDGSKGSAWINYGYKGSGDILGLTKKTGRYFAVENKTEDGELSPEQLEYRDRIISHNGIYIVARSLDKLEQNKDLLLG